MDPATNNNRYFYGPAPELEEKVPFEVRANPLVDSDHPDFLDREEYFNSLLTNTELTLREILYGTFDPHEILLFEQATFPPELVQLQRDNTIRYQRILESRFRNHESSLPLKLAFLYFGLPVAPMKPGTAHVNLPLDLDFGADKTVVEADPFEFLDDHAERTHGDASKRVTDPYLPRIHPTQEFPSLKLRGGAEPENMGWEFEDDDTETSVSRVRVWGFQGSVLTKPSNSLWESFVEAVDQLLGVKYEFDYMVCVEIWKLSDVEGPVSRTKGMIHHGRLKSPENDPIYSLVHKWFDDADFAETHNCFVYYDKEAPPPFYQPPWKVARYIVRIWDEASKNMAYMKVPEQLQLTHKHNQYLAEYQRAMRVLYRDNHHQYVGFDADKGRLTYGLFDPPIAVWKQATEDQAQNDQLPTLSFEILPIPTEVVAVWVPGWYVYNADFYTRHSPIHTGGFLMWDDLKSKGEEDRVSLTKLLDKCAAASELASESEDRIGVDVWLPGERFLDLDSKPDRLTITANEISERTLFDWQHILGGFQASRIHAPTSPMSIVARPVFRDYQFQVRNNSSRVFAMDINRADATLAAFKATVKSRLYPAYTGSRDDQVLYLLQTTWGQNELNFAIRADTSEDEWELIVRRITEPEIEVSLEYWKNNWVVEKDTVWGPRYDSTEIREVTSHFESQWKPRPYDPRLERFFKRSGNNRDGADRAEILREKYFWDIPGVFTNPAKPGIPIHGTPVETIVKTGPNVPGFTTAMRTPTEVARLEREVHTLRGNLLERIRECPYMDCQRYFPFKDGDGLARHLREDHAVLQCFLCTKTTALYLHDSGSLRQHFLEEHYNDLRELFGISADLQPISQGSHYCNRCGRDLAKLKNPKDQIHHSRACIVGDPSSSRYCIFCGREGVASTCVCNHRKDRSSDAGNFCEVCGLEYDSTMNRLYREHHRAHCRQPGGEPNDFCPRCGIIMVDISDADRSKHISWCGAPTDHIPSRRSSILPVSGKPTGEKGYDDSSIIEIDDEDLGDLIDAINQQVAPEKHRRSREGTRKSKSSTRPRTDIPSEHRLVLWREPTALDTIPPRRSRSPFWNETLGEEPEYFWPAPDWRCSRCFRAAGENIEEIEGHMDPTRSCRIRRGLGTTIIGKTPNRSGWIQPAEDFDFSKAYFDFVKRYPAYKYTMFPVRDENVAKVWSEPFDLRTAIGSIEDDPNHRGPLFVQTRSGDLPWPPYEGTVIPLTGSEPPSPTESSQSDTPDPLVQDIDTRSDRPLKRRRPEPGPTTRQRPPTGTGTDAYGNVSLPPDWDRIREIVQQFNRGVNREGGVPKKITPGQGTKKGALPTPDPTPKGTGRAFVAQARLRGARSGGGTSLRPYTAGATTYATTGAGFSWPTASGSYDYRASSMPPPSAGSRVTSATDASSRPTTRGTSSYRPSTSGTSSYRMSSVPPSSARSHSTFASHASRPPTTQSGRPSSSYGSRPATEWSTHPSESQGATEDLRSEAPSTGSRKRARAQTVESEGQPRRRSGRIRREQQ
ncbi:hypothetical protein F5Y05DRAFT_389016 [Hypoxylon sp. FL0543]|nr:hypothetical protein F5Y05DRAFT_389016 [Hypoxylon sp. FL0543]